MGKITALNQHLMWLRAPQGRRQKAQGVFVGMEQPKPVAKKRDEMRKITTLRQLVVWLLRAMKASSRIRAVPEYYADVLELIVFDLNNGKNCPDSGMLTYMTAFFGSHWSNEFIEMNGAHAKFVRRVMRLATPQPGRTICAAKLVAIAARCHPVGEVFYFKTKKGKRYIRATPGSKVANLFDVNIPIDEQEYAIINKLKTSRN